MTPQNRFILLGGLAGAALGATAAYAYLKSQETGLWTHKREHGREVAVQAGLGDFFRIGLAIFGIVRQIQSMTKPQR